MHSYIKLDKFRNEDIKNYLQVHPKSNTIVEFRLKFFQHVQRLNNDRFPKTALTYK
jgi:hypothetical protein